MMSATPPDLAVNEEGMPTASRGDGTSLGPMPRADRLAMVRYGFVQPFVGLRTLLGAPSLRKLAVFPVLVLAVLAGLAAKATFAELGPSAGLLAFLGTVVALAPLSPVLTSGTYAQLAAESRVVLGLSAHAPQVRPRDLLMLEWLTQLALVSVGVAPYVALAGSLPWIGAAVALLLQAAWVLHWVVVEALDGARTLAAGQTEEAEASDRTPWFVRWFDHLPGPQWLYVPLAPLYVFGTIVAAFALSWNREMALMEDHPWVSLGFGLGAAAMLLVPGLNLLLRPAVVVAAVHLRHQMLADPAVEGSPPASEPGAGASARDPAS